MKEITSPYVALEEIYKKVKDRIRDKDHGGCLCESCISIPAWLEEMEQVCEKGLDIESPIETRKKLGKVDACIKLLKKNFPNYTYENAMRTKSFERGLFGNFSVFVMNIPEEELGKFTEFYFNEIYLKGCEKDEEFPNIVTLKNRVE